MRKPCNYALNLVIVLDQCIQHINVQHLIQVEMSYLIKHDLEQIHVSMSVSSIVLSFLEQQKKFYFSI